MKRILALAALAAALVTIQGSKAASSSAQCSLSAACSADAVCDPSSCPQPCSSSCPLPCATHAEGSVAGKVAAD